VQEKIVEVFPNIVEEVLNASKVLLSPSFILSKCELFNDGTSLDLGRAVKEGVFVQTLLKG